MANFISLTDPSPFHQLILLSQRTINDSFKNMWGLAQIDDDSPLKHLYVKFRSGDYLDTDIGVPSVQLQVTTKDPMLYFMLRMTKGSVFLYLSNDAANDETKTLTVDEWTFAFSVTVSKKEITKDSPEYKEFQERAGLPESVFSLQQLFIDTSSSTKWNEELSDFGAQEQEFKGLTPDAHATFTTFIQQWLNLMEARGCNILGYSAQGESDSDLNEYEPTFPPTHIEYDCYPWRNNPTDQDENNQDTNALSYLMMSNFESPPSKTLSYTGQYVDSSHDATYVMNRSLFWPWITTELRKVVIGTIPIPDEPTCYWDNTDHDHPYMMGPNYHFGDRGAESNDYTFTSTGQPGKWHWQGHVMSSVNTATNPNNSSDSMVVQQYSNSDTNPGGGELSFEAGKEGIVLTGKSSFEFHANHYSSRNTYTIMTFYLTWRIDVAMAAVDEGGLVFKISYTDSHCDHKTEGNMSWSIPIEEFATELNTAMTNKLKDAISDVEDNLMNALANQHRLFLPAKGSFLMKDPVFNSKGDLMVKLTYNGADPPPARKHPVHKE